MFTYNLLVALKVKKEKIVSKTTIKRKIDNTIILLDKLSLRQRLLSQELTAIPSIFYAISFASQDAEKKPSAVCTFLSEPY